MKGSCTPSLWAWRPRRSRAITQKKKRQKKNPLKTITVTPTPFFCNVRASRRAAWWQMRACGVGWWGMYSCGGRVPAGGWWALALPCTACARLLTATQAPSQWRNGTCGTTAQSATRLRRLLWALTLLLSQSACLAFFTIDNSIIFF